jgi:hypothetical protein
MAKQRKLEARDDQREQMDLWYNPETQHEIIEQVLAYSEHSYAYELRGDGTVYVWKS